jgi:hypothetical protein
MIYIEKDTTNQFAVEATCGLPEADNLFLIMGILWEGESFKQWRVITLNEESPAPMRYNLFSFTESSMGSEGVWYETPIGVPEPEDAIKLELGQYQFFIWGAAEPWDSTDYDGSFPPAKTSGAITNGRLIVVGEIESPYDSIIPNVAIPSVYD